MPRKRRGRGEGGVYQRGDGLWVGSASLGFDPRTGNRRRKTVYGGTKSEALAELRAIDPAALPERADTTLERWLGHWVKAIGPTVEPGTLAPYERHCRLHITPRIGRVKLSKLRATDIEAFYAGLLGEGMSPALARKVGVTLTIALNAAVRSGELTANPAAAVRKPKADKPKIEILTPDQARALTAAAAGHRLGAMWVLMLDAGTGPGETFALTWADVDPDGRAVTVSKSLEEIAGKLRVKKTKTKSRVRRVEVSNGTASALLRHREAMRDEGRDVEEGPVFVDTVGKYMRGNHVYSREWKPFLKEASLPEVSLYALRHTCATLLLLAKINPKVVSERLGHSTITLTMDTYSHVLPTMQREAADVMGRLLAPDPEQRAKGKTRQRPAIGYS